MGRTLAFPEPRAVVQAPPGALPQADGSESCFAPSILAAEDSLNDQRRTVAIVGFSPNSRDLAPYKDEQAEIWVVTTLYRHVPRYTRVFDLHEVDCIEAGRQHIPGERCCMKIAHGDQFPDVDKFFREVAPSKGVPIYMREARPEYPSSVKYPKDEMISRFGRTPFTNSISYMLALALAEGFDRIELYGVDMKDKTEYAVQRPGVLYLIGLAEGMGVDLYVHPWCCIKEVPRLYALDPPLDSPELQTLYKRHAKLKALHATCQEKADEGQRQIDEATDKSLILDGMCQEIAWQIEQRRDSLNAGGRPAWE